MVNELLSQLHPTFPQVLCFSEHHMNQSELQHTFLDGYNLRVCYCRTSHIKGGVCIFVQNGIRCTNIDLGNYCKDKDFEVCACKIHFGTKRICIITIYRAPSGCVDTFITKLDTILEKLFSSTLDVIICGDININYLTDNARKRELEALLKTYNLTSIINFPTRTQQKSATAIDNIFIDATRIGNYTIYPIINGLSDHDAQSITFHTINSKPPTSK